jgi:signal transduction histidine kinase
MADEEALIKVFSNLFSNAVKYGQEQVHITLLQPKGEEDEVIIQIANDGPIIPEEMKERIFEPFYRLKETIRQKGTGIGLALARSLVELHKGRLFLDDTWPGMNIFTLILPRRPQPGNKKKNRSQFHSNTTK